MAKFPESEDEVCQALDRLVEQGLQSDQRFIEHYIRYRVARGFGPLRIEQELQHKGVRHDIIRQGLAEYVHQWPMALRQAWQKKYKRQLPEDASARAKQYRFLLMRGFTPEQIHELLSSLSSNV